MFTGIVEGIGKIKKIKNFKHSTRWWIEAPFSLSKDKLGDSIAVEGCCLTLIEKKQKVFAVDISPETLDKTCFNQYAVSGVVNLERALRLGDRLGGHWVQGHVDGIGKIKSLRWTDQVDGKYLWLKISFPKNLRKYFVSKGSVTVNGVSLTVNAIQTNSFELCIIPHTQLKTTLINKKVGDEVNLEVDVLAKYVENMLKSG